MLTTWTTHYPKKALRKIKYTVFPNKKPPKEIFFAQQTIPAVSHTPKLTLGQTQLEQEYLFHYLTEKAKQEQHNPDALLYSLPYKLQQNHTVLPLTAKLIEPTSQTFIAQPALAQRLLLTPDLLRELAQKIKSNLIFPHETPKNLMTLQWGNTFSSEESDQQHTWRWALDTTNFLNITNLSPNTQKITFTTTFQTLCKNHSSLKIYFLNDVFTYPFRENQKVMLSLLVPPGTHKLIFVYQGQIISQEHDTRQLTFALHHFKMTTENQITPVLTENKIREILHANHFFEVQAIEHCEQSHLKRQLAITRYHQSGKFYQLKAAEPAPQNFNGNITWFLAKRTCTLMENN